jgi:UDP-N-acetylmuramate dehydrogenase
VAEFCATNALSGMEFLSAIPGTLGGNLKTNAGCYGCQISDHLYQVEGMDFNGEKVLLSNSDISFSYRHSNLPGNIVYTKIHFKLKKGVRDAILAKTLEIKSKKNDSQPTKSRTSGSTFVNPPGHHAWELISDAGMRGFLLGDAQVSEKHANFLINKGNATSQDIEDLALLVAKKVKEKFGIDLRMEIEVIGSRDSK